MDKMCMKSKVEESDKTMTNAEEAESAKRCESPVFKCVNHTKPVRGSHLDSNEFDISSYQLNQSIKSRTSSKFNNEISESNVPFSPIFSPIPIASSSQFQPPSIHSVGTVAKNLAKCLENTVSDSNGNKETQKYGGIFESLGMTNKDISWASSMASPPPKNVPGSEFNTVEKATFLPEENFQSIQPRALFSPTLDEDSGCHPITFTSESDDEVYKSSIRLSDVCATLKKLEFKSLDCNSDYPVKKIIPEDDFTSPVIRAKNKKLENVRKKRGVLVISPDKKDKYEFSVGANLGVLEYDKAKSLDKNNSIKDDSFQSVSFICIDELCKTLVSEQSNSSVGSTSSNCDKTVLNSKPSVLKKFYSTKDSSEVYAMTSMDDLQAYIIALEEGDNLVPRGEKINQAYADKGIVRFDILDKTLSESSESKHTEVTEEEKLKNTDKDNCNWEKMKQYLSESQLNVSDGEIFRTVDNLEKTLASQESKESERLNADGGDDDDNNDDDTNTDAAVAIAAPAAAANDDDDDLQDETGLPGSSNILKAAVKNSGIIQKKPDSKISDETNRVKVHNVSNWCQDFSALPFSAFTTVSGLKISVSEKALNKAKQILKDCEESFKTDTKKMVAFSSDAEKSSGNPKRQKQISSEEVNKDDFSFEPEKLAKNLAGMFATASGNQIQVSEKALKKAKDLMSRFDEEEKTYFDSISTKSLDVVSNIELQETQPEMNGLMTGLGKPVQVSVESVEMAKALLLEPKGGFKKNVNEVPGVEKGDVNERSQNPTGFLTSSGKTIQISTEALEKAKAFMKYCNDEFSESCDIMQINSAYDIGTVKLCEKSGEKQLENPPIAFSTGIDNLMIGSNKTLGKPTAFLSKTEIPSLTLPQVDTSFPGFATAGGKKVSISESAMNKARERMLLWDQDKPDSENRTTDSCEKNILEASNQNQRKPISSGSDEPDDWDEIVPNWLHVYNTSPSIASDRVELPSVISHEDGETFKAEREYVIRSPVLGLNDRFYGKRKKKKLRSEEESTVGLVAPTKNSGRKASVKRTLALDFSIPFKRMKFAADIENIGVDIKNERVHAREKQEKYINEKQKVQPLKGSHLNRKTSEKQKSWMEATEGASPKLHSDEFLKKIGVRKYVLKITIENAVSARFDGEDFFGSECRTNATGIPTGDGCLLILDDDNRFGVEEVKRAFLASPGVQPNLLPCGWVENHYKWIIWKLAHYERSFPQFFGGKCLTPDHVMLQLKYRYDREIDRNERSALKKILERDDASAKRLVLCICGIKKISVGETVGYELQLTDGWYSCPVRCDPAMMKLIEKEKLCVGTKLMTQGAILVNCEQGVSPLEMSGDVYLKIFTNSTRRIRWDTKLGFQKNPGNFPISLGSILAQGGPISRIDVIIVRIYPMLYMEKTVDGHHVTRNRKSEEKADAEYRRIREQRIEMIRSEVQSELRRSARLESKSNGNHENVNDLSQSMNTGSNPSALQDAMSLSQGSQNDCFSREVTEKIEKKLQQENLTKRNVSEFFRVKIVDLRKPDYNNPALLTIWNPNEDLITLLSEGKAVSVLNVTISNSARIYKPLQINTTRQSHYRQIPKTVKYPARKLTPLKNVSSKICPAFEEVDLVGMVALIQDVSYGSRLSQIVYLTDLEMNFVGVVFWGSCKDYGWENVLKISSVVACSNLQWKKNPSPQEVPSLYVNENSVFTENPRQNYLKEEMEKLKEIMPKQDVTSFLCKCEEDLTNKLEDSKWRTNTSKNSSSECTILRDAPPPKPRVLNGFESEPTASSTPIKPFSAKTNPDVAEPSPIQRKIEKLQAYGEPPSLIPLIVRNNAKRKFRKKS